MHLTDHKYQSVECAEQCDAARAVLRAADVEMARWLGVPTDHPAVLVVLLSRALRPATFSEFCQLLLHCGSQPERYRPVLQLFDRRDGVFGCWTVAVRRRVLLVRLYHVVLCDKIPHNLPLELWTHVAQFVDSSALDVWAPQPTDAVWPWWRL